MKSLLAIFFMALLSLFIVGGKAAAAEESGSSKVELRYFGELSKEETDRIDYIMNFITTKSTFVILKNKKQLNEEGNKFVDLHPLRFWKEVLTGKYREKLPDISYLVKRDMVKRLSDDLAITDKAGGMKEEYIEDFAASTNIPLDEIHKYSEKKDWRGLGNLILSQK